MKRKPKTITASLVDALAGKTPAQANSESQEDLSKKEVVPEPKAEEQNKPEPKAEEQNKPEPKAEQVENELVKHLKQDLQDSRAENSRLVTELAKSQVKADSLSTEVTSLKAVNDKAMMAIREMTERLSIGLGTKIAGLESLSGENLLAQWSKVKAEFDSRFVTGGRAHAEASEETGAEPINPTVSRGVKATKLK